MTDDELQRQINELAAMVQHLYGQVDMLIKNQPDPCNGDGSPCYKKVCCGGWIQGFDTND